MRSVWLAALWVAPVLAQGPARAVFIASPTAIVVVGGQVQLSATARDADGAARQGDAFTWRTNDSSIIAIDQSGVATAKGLGVATVSASVGNINGSLRLETGPARVRVTPSSGEIYVGDTLAFAAEAQDIDGNPIPNAVFQWQLTGANGNQSNAGSLSRDGKLTALGLGHFTVRALLNISGVPAGPFVGQFVGLANVLAKRRPEFRLSRLLSAQSVRPTAQLRRVRYMAANAGGQIAVIAGLDGVSESLLLYENGRWDTLFSAGAPGSQTGVAVRSLDFLSMNSRGQCLFRARESDGTGALMLATREQVRVVFLGGESAGEIESIGNFSLSRTSLNDSGDFVFQAGFRFTGSTVDQSGLFKVSGPALQVVWLARDPLPGIGASYGFRDFGMDNDGNVFFRVDDGRRQAVYRAGASGLPAPVAASGDKVDGAPLTGMDQLAVSPSGDLYMRAFFASQNARLVRFPRNATAPQALEMFGWGPVFAASAEGVLFGANTGPGYGLQKWTGTGASQYLALNGRIAANGEPISELQDAVFGPPGTPIALVRTADTPFLAMSAGGTPAALFSFGARIGGFTNLAVDSFVRGGQYGSADVLMGNGGGIFQFDGSSLRPRVVAGDRLPSGSFFRNYQAAAKTPAGDLFFSADDGLYLQAGSRLTRFLQYPMTSADKLPLYSTYGFAVNSSRVVVSSNWAGDHHRLNFVDSGRVSTLASDGQNPKYRTALPSGGTVTGWREFAIDDDWRVMANLTVAGAASGYYLYDNAVWKPVMLIGSTEFPGEIVTQVDGLRARGGKFYAVIRFRAGGHTIAEYGRDGWKRLLSRFDDINGVILQFVDTFDVNGKGELAIIGNMGSYRAALLFADGKIRTAHLSNETGVNGEYLTGFWELEVHNDRSMYVLGIDANDYEYVYLAEPLS